MSQSGADFNSTALIRRLDPDRHVMIAGPTASGKSALAREIAARQGGIVVNADAMQVFAGWRILTARPGAAETACAPHHLYGHVPFEGRYSVGDWLRDLAPMLGGDARLIITGGTGLYFTALTEGLAAIPPVPREVREEAEARLAEGGADALLDGIDIRTRAAIDTANPARLRRAWEVRRATGRGLADWQAETGPPPLPLAQAEALVLGPDREALTARIAARLDRMLEAGALDEVRGNLTRLDAAPQAGRAIGACELAGHVTGRISLDAAREAAIIATRRYARRQRSWMRNRLGHWPHVALDG